MSSEKCARCGGEAESRDNIIGTSFWGAITRETTVTALSRLRFRATYLRRFGRDAGAPPLRVDEANPLCSDCWGLLVGRFMKGRSVPALHNAHRAYTDAATHLSRLQP